MPPTKRLVDHALSFASPIRRVIRQDDRRPGVGYSGIQDTLHAQHVIDDIESAEWVGPLSGEFELLLTERQRQSLRQELQLECDAASGEKRDDVDLGGWVNTSWSELQPNLDIRKRQA